MLSEGSQLAKDKYHMTSLKGGIRETKGRQERRKGQAKKQTQNYREQSGGYMGNGGWSGERSEIDEGD